MSHSYVYFIFFLPFKSLLSSLAYNLPLVSLLCHPVSLSSASWPLQTTHSNRLSSISVWLLVTHRLLSHSNLPPVFHPLPPKKYTSTLSLSSVHSPTTSPLSLYAPSPVTPPHPASSRLPCYHSPFSSSIPSSLFRFQTPFGWSIGLCLANDSEVVWTVVDSLLEVQLPYIPLMYSSLHWLMERGVTGQPFIVEEAGTEKQINTCGIFALILDSLFWSHCQ